MRGLFAGLQVHRGIFAATIDLDLERQAVAFVERRHAGALDRRDVHERIGLAVVALNEAEALHRIEELDRAGRLLAGQLALRAAAVAATAAEATLAGRARRALFHRHRLAVDLEIGRRDAATAIDQREAERLALGQAGQAGLLDCRYVHEHILAAVVTDDEAEALLSIEELDGA